jgi:hypothetical protein
VGEKAESSVWFRALPSEQTRIEIDGVEAVCRIRSADSGGKTIAGNVVEEAINDTW